MMLQSGKKRKKKKKYLVECSVERKKNGQGTFPLLKEIWITNLGRDLTAQKVGPSSRDALT